MNKWMGMRTFSARIVFQVIYIRVEVFLQTDEVPLITMAERARQLVVFDIRKY